MLLSGSQPRQFSFDDGSDGIELQQAPMREDPPILIGGVLLASQGYISFRANKQWIRPARAVNECEGRVAFFIRARFLEQRQRLGGIVNPQRLQSPERRQIAEPHRRVLGKALRKR